MSNNKYIKTRFSLRKNKKYKNLVSVGLGLFIATAVGAVGNEAYASENKVTNYTETQSNSSDKTILEKAIENAENNGIKIEVGEVVELGTARTLEEARKLQEKVQEEINKQTEQINKKVDEYKIEVNNYEAEVNRILEENKQAQAEYEKKLVEYNTEKPKIEAENAKLKADYEKAKADAEKLAKEIEDSNMEIHVANELKRLEYEKKLAEYNKLKEEFDRKLAELELNKNKNGYLSEALAQNLIFQNEPNAKIEKVEGGNAISYLEFKKKVFSKNAPEWYDYTIKENKDYDFNLIKNGETIKVTYTNIQNSSYKNFKISKVVYKYTLKESSVGEAALIFYEDPTKTLNYYSYPNDSLKITMEVEFYDDNGNEIIPLDSLISFSSLNNSQWLNQGGYEYVSSFSGRFIKITGSSVTNNNGIAYSLNNNNERSKGSMYNYLGTSGWDKDGSSIEYYGAIVGQTKDKIKFDIGNTFWGKVWFSFNTLIKIKEVPNNIIPPQKPNYEVEKPTIIKLLTPPEYKALPTKPKEPKYKEIPNSPKAPTLQINEFSYEISPGITIEPKKYNENKDGVVIDGKTLLPNTVNYYKLLWDLDQYKGIKASKEDIAKGFYFIEDYPEEALMLNEKDVKLIDSNGKEVSGVKVEAFTSVANATDEVKAMLEKAQITPKGAFQLFTAINPEQFFTDYVEAGTSINIVSPMTVKNTFNGDYENKAYQVDFGNGYETDLVENNVSVPTPTKNNTNEKGVNINGKTLLPGSVNYYKLLWDFSSYKDINASNEAIGKGFFRLDDYPEEALNPNLDGVRLVDTNGEAPTGVKVEVFESLESASEVVKTMLERAKITPTGAFQIFYAENPEEFFNKYVKTGNSIEIAAPMIVKEAFTGEYVNKSHQGDFGVGYETEEVVNNVPNIDPKKDVVIDVSNKDKSLDGATIEKGTVFNYYLKGGLLPANRGEDIKQYDFIDDYDEKGDEYNGVYKVFSAVDIKLLDGTVLKAGTELTKYTIQNVDTKDGVVNVNFDTEFLSKVDNDSEFQAEIYLQMKRIASGEFENTFINVINGVEFKSNTVKTNTPEPPTPVEPKVPENPTPEQPKKQLPKTSAVKTPQTEDTNTTNAVVVGMLVLGTLTATRRRKAS